MPAAAAAAAAVVVPSLHLQRQRFSSPRKRILPRARSYGATRSGAVPSSFAAEGPSCLFVGPIETASKEMLEALYLQARDAYYSGKPLIVDDMFDKVELKLRIYGSKSVVKYPRCSLRQQSTYADAEEDPSQVFALAGIWTLLLVFGASVLVAPAIFTIGQAFKDGVSSSMLLFNVKALEGLWRRDLVALKGSCPNCGEEVFAFVKTDKPFQRGHSAECHVCGSALEFRTKVEQSTTRYGNHWVYGRVYLVRRT
ncbi:PGR5-like protein 1A, chloroplastic isoform X3 [Dioscorea cayenensis subsp. rotundata]|uniref:PGR5-like protein 1A, chloroplastic isoform X3 n=1 Tax=Dioscorea cayennensis subsp. rotundata TaxID=55577 RepID=A0AB40BLZ9_DIOCR|nr:PGR5-like protein 1A, chloroplastic isoform X3 [Dioscorea cayenensis subsp. rotundata]